MRKVLLQNGLQERGGFRTLAALSLAISLAAFGCTTNRTPGDGQPMSMAPAGGSVAPSSSVTPGSSSGTTVTTPRTMISSSPEEALAILRVQQGHEGRYLGQANPAPAAVTGQSVQQPTGQFISPSLYANPQTTVNSSISSEPVPAIVSGAGEGIAGGGAVATVGTTTGTTAAATVTNAGATPVLTTAGAQVGVFSTGTATGIAPSSNALATPTMGLLGVNRVGTAGRVTSGTTTRTSTVRNATITNSVTAPVRIQMSPTGTVTVTNLTGAQQLPVTRPALGRVRAVTKNGSVTTTP